MFYDIFLKLCDIKHVSRTKACIDCEVSRTAWRKWINGGIPNGTTLSAFAEYFGVTTDYLLGAEKEKTPTQEGERKSDVAQAKIALFGGDGEVTDEMWEEAIFAAQLIKERYKRKKD